MHVQISCILQSGGNGGGVLVTIDREENLEGYYAVSIDVTKSERIWF